MNLTGSIVLFMTLWFLVFYLVLQLRTHTQAEAGKVVPGTPASAPAKEDVGRSAWLATIFAILSWVVIAGPIFAGWITLEDIDVAGVLKPPAAESE